jgi:hypothetical protein
MNNATGWVQKLTWKFVPMNNDHLEKTPQKAEQSSRDVPTCSKGSKWHL